MSKSQTMRRGYSRRGFLGLAGRSGAAAAAVAAAGVPRTARAQTRGWLTEHERAVLDAALARMIPRESEDDWNAADAGAGDYIDRLLSGRGEIYAGGPYRASFRRWRHMGRTKEIGWAREVDRLRRLYRQGIAELDDLAGGDFANRTFTQQDAILAALDSDGSPFFAALYAHTMEGVYSHPVYGGNRDFRAWRDLCYEGDVHGVRFPVTGSPGSWNVYGGYAPEEIAEPGKCD